MIVFLALGLAVAYALLYAAQGRGWVDLTGLDGLLGALRGYGPTVAAVLTAWWAAGRGGLRELATRLTHWRVGWRVYALAILVPAAVTATVAVLVGWRANLDWTVGEVRPGRLVLIFFVFALIDGPLGEEVGWRGYLLPRLLEIVRPVPASVAIGLVWFVWHLPLYAADGSRTLDLTFLLLYAALNVAYAVLHTWLFLRAGGSALPAVVFHTAGNYFVFLAWTLFPALHEVPGVRGWQVGALSLLAVAAAFDLRRRSAGLRTTEIAPRSAGSRRGRPR